MVQQQDNPSQVATQPFHLRKLTRSGKGRSLYVGGLVPQDWRAVKVFVEQVNGGVCILRLEQIK